MSDIDSQLPIRSVADGTDERVHVKIVDYDDPSGVDKQVQVSEKKVHVRNHSKDSDGNDQEQLLSQEGHSLTNGDYDATNNKRPSSNGQILHDRKLTGETAGEADQNFRPTGVSYDDGVKVVNSADVAIRDEDGIPFSKSNPLPVAIEESEGLELHDYFQSVAAIAKNNNDEHIFTSAAPEELELEQFGISGSGFMRGELQVETAAASGVFNTKVVIFNSTAKPNEDIVFKRPIKVPTGARVKIIRENLDNQSQTMYSFINGLEN